MTRKPVSFLATSNPEAAGVFYGKTLGLAHVETSLYALVFSDGGQMLRVQIVAEFSPAAHTVHGWQVANIDQEVAELTSKGVVFESFGQLEQSPSGVWTSPDGNCIAWFRDPSGNILSLTQMA